MIVLAVCASVIVFALSYAVGIVTEYHTGRGDLAGAAFIASQIALTSAAIVAL